MMIAIVYASIATVPFDQKMLMDLYDASVRKNRQLGLTGYLSWKNDHFFHYLEGPKNTVNDILQAISIDSRHKVTRVMQLGSIEQRRFSQWEMLNMSGRGAPDIGIQDLAADVIRSTSGDAFAEEESRSIMLKLMDQMSKLRRTNHIKSLVNDADGVDIGDEPPFVVVLAASAGGLYPLQSIVRSLDPELDAAFIVIQHLAPDVETFLDVILQRDTSMKVCPAVREMKVLAGRIYVIPPGENLEVSDGRFDLSKQERSNQGVQVPIDICLRSIASEYGDRAVAVILSGTGTDGSRGAKVLKEAGGVVLVQSPDSAEFDGMPKASIKSGMAHQILAPADIAEFINNLSGDYVHDSLALWPARRAMYVSEIVSLLKDEHVDFTQYKSETLFRRIERRRVQAGIATSDDYVEFVKSSEEERNELREDILITVTSFFRDPEAWESLKQSLVPLIVSQWTKGETLRVWASACATGEEAYTIGIVLTELMEDLDKKINFKIYATDIERKALKFASIACYSERAVAQMSLARRNRFFKRRADGYVIVPEIRKSIMFSPHNFIKDAPFTRMHLVTCRNVLIYMQPELQQIAIKMLHVALNVDGILFLGPAETLNNLQREFHPVQRAWNQHRKLRDLPLPSHVSSNRQSDASSDGSDNKEPLQPAVETQSNSLIGLSLDAIAQHSGNTNVLIDSGRSVRMVLSDPDGLLQVHTHDDNPDIADIIAESLRPSLKFAINLAFRDRKTALHRDLPFRSIGKNRQVVSIEVVPRFKPGEPEANLALVVFSVYEQEARGTAPGQQADSGEIRNLRRQLDETRNALQTAIDDLESSSEQQRAINEQFAAANDELQSSNKELQSVNEELYSVNYEYQSKIHELSDLNQDLDNLLDKTYSGVVFLDSDLCIRRFTRAVAQTLELTVSDIGRPFVDVSHDLGHTDLEDDMRRVLSIGKAIIREIDRSDADLLEVGIHPYKASSGLAQGVVVTFRRLTKSSSPVPALEGLDIAR